MWPAEHLILCIDDVPPAACALALPTKVRMKKGILRAESRPGRSRSTRTRPTAANPNSADTAATVKVTEGRTAVLPAILQPINRHDSYCSICSCLFLPVFGSVVCSSRGRAWVAGLPVFCNRERVSKAKKRCRTRHWFERRQAVEIKSAGKGYRVVAFGHEPVPVDSIVDGAIIDAGAVADAIRRVFDGKKVSRPKKSAHHFPEMP